MLYKQAFDQAYQQSDYCQAFYKEINVDFLELALYRNRCNARQIAVHVLRQCRLAPKEKWCLATVSKAQLYPSKVDYYVATLILGLICA